MICLRHQCVLGIRSLKKTLEIEKYILNPNYGERIAMCKLRRANIKLLVYNRICMFDTDICKLCLSGDEYHYVLICPFYHSINILIKPYFLQQTKHNEI